MSNAASSPGVCPLCAKANACALACSKTEDAPCWCRGMTISPQTLGRIPPAQQGLACICPTCAGAPGPSASNGTGPRQGQ